MRRTKRYPLCLTCFPQKNPELSGSRDHGASGHPAGFHVQDPAVSDFYVEPKGGAALCRLTSVLFGPPSGGLRKSVGAGLSSRRLFGPTLGHRARGLHGTTRLGGRRRGRDVLYRNDPISIRVEGPIERVDRHPRGRIETLSRAICSRSPPSPAPRTPPDLPLPASSPPPACGPPRCLLPPPAPR